MLLSLKEVVAFNGRRKVRIQIVSDDLRLAYETPLVFRLVPYMHQDLRIRLAEYIKVFKLAARDKEGHSLSELVGHHHVW